MRTVPPISDAEADRRRDTRADYRALLAGSGLIGVLFAIGAAADSTWLYGHVSRDPGSQFGGRLLANIILGAVDLAVLVALRPELRRGRWARGITVTAAAVVAAGARVAAHTLLGVYAVATPGTRLAEFASGFLIAMAANLLGMGFLISRQRVRRQARATALDAIQFKLAVSALQGEEIRVRREVAEGLHGSLQQRLVLVTARIDALVDRLAAGPATAGDVASLREISLTLDRIRQGDVREMSRMLYPDGLEVGMVPAVRSLLVRLPASIATNLVVSDAVRRLDDPASPLLAQGERLLAVRVVEEAVTNALRHGAATRIEVRLAERAGDLIVEVHDNGCGFDVGAVPRSGTARLADRLSLAGGRLEMRSDLGTGSVIAASFPVMAPVTGPLGLTRSSDGR
ncbi:sensor histidine kinase [Pengzhenrongella frigida]|uniref:histidine kinase n=1 Tax=Pengzhenrongella frigida TaxID=1259133 RepID=A0A4Q5N1U0_9MICO|nr:ATP-binding protein [Cellulomonas sp. HLT2-17]RYV51243.1 ATP-binding protein [Cellulomonas sp. HLT2-17]